MGLDPDTGATKRCLLSPACRASGPSAAVGRSHGCLCPDGHGSCRTGERGRYWTAQVVPSQASANVTAVTPKPWDPTAVQALAELHDTPYRMSSLGSGVFWATQVVPSHLSTKSPLPYTCKGPTAVQRAELHETALSSPTGSGIFWAAQVVPSHASATGPTASSSKRACSDPTAVHKLGEHDTLVRPLSTPLPTRLGVFWTAQVVPSHRSAKGAPTPPMSWDPTAVQALAELHDTASRELAAGSDGVFWTAQAVPSHATTNAAGLPVVFALPTAVQASGELHDTPPKELPAGSAGMSWAAQALPSHSSANGSFSLVGVW